jgi:hypothetical protein
MTEIHDLLERAVDHPGGLDPIDDLHRGRRALRRRRTRLAGVVGGLALIAGVGLTTLSEGRLSAHGVLPASGTGDALVHTQYFDVPQPPDGWHVGYSDQMALTLAPDGVPDTHPELFDGKVAVIIDPRGEWFGFGPTTEYDGRTFYDNERNDGYPILAVRLEDGRFLQLQYPTSAGFSQEEMIRYLDGVVVNPGACQGEC